MNKLLLSIVFISCICLACKKSWLDKKPNQNIAAPETLKDLQALMDNSDLMNRQGGLSLVERGSDDLYLTDANFNNSNDQERNSYTWSNNPTYTTQYDWTYAYQRVVYCNIVLEELQKITTTTDADRMTWNDIKGQALFQRARNFYELAQTFSPPFDVSTQNESLGIPLRLESDINIPSKRSTVKETYDRIVNDLNETKSLLPSSATFKTRPNVAAALAMLARVYLSIENYDMAYDNANSCLSLANSLLDYNTLDSNVAMPFPIYNQEVLFHNSMMYWTSIAFNGYIPNSLLTLYDSNDLRKNLYFKNNGTYFTFRGVYDDKSGGTPFTGLATDEIYLIRAECYARKGNTSAAMNDLNALMKKRWKSTSWNQPGSGTPFTATDANDALNKILTERRKELLFRGTRWTDLRRLNKDSRFAVTLSRTVNGKTYTLAPNSYQYTIPLGADLIKQTGMQQNPGW